LIVTLGNFTVGFFTFVRAVVVGVYFLVRVVLVLVDLIVFLGKVVVVETVTFLTVVLRVTGFLTVVVVVLVVLADDFPGGTPVAP
jgi:hypothetical protein